MSPISIADSHPLLQAVENAKWTSFSKVDSETPYQCRRHQANQPKHQARPPKYQSINMGCLVVGQFFLMGGDTI